MGITAKSTGSGQQFDPIEEGMHHAICYALYDLGTQYNERYGNSARKVLIVWELPDEMIAVTRNDTELQLPRSVSKKYTLSLHEKAVLRKDLESWRGKSFSNKELEGFDITKLLGVNCTLQVLHKRKDDKTYANIVSIVPVMKGTTKKDPQNDVRYFSFEEHDQLPENTPDWIIDIIKNSDEWEALQNPNSIEKSGQGYDERNPPDDDIPF
jgi:hypothetical protein